MGYDNGLVYININQRSRIHQPKSSWCLMFNQAINSVVENPPVLRRDSLIDGEIKGDVPVAIGGTNMHWPRPVKQWWSNGGLHRLLVWRPRRPWGRFWDFPRFQTYHSNIMSLVKNWSLKLNTHSGGDWNLIPKKTMQTWSKITKNRSTKHLQIGDTGGCASAGHLGMGQNPPKTASWSWQIYQKIYIQNILKLVGGWATYPSEKWWSSIVGTTEWKVIKFMFQTTNQKTGFDPFLWFFWRWLRLKSKEHSLVLPYASFGFIVWHTWPQNQWQLVPKKLLYFKWKP